MRLKGKGSLESIHIIKKPGGALKVSASRPGVVDTYSHRGGWG
jgi:hypothetical protein